MLFSGVSDFAGQYRTHEMYYYSNKHKVLSIENLNSELQAIENMGDDDEEQIISKYIRVLYAHPFTDGNKRVGNIWVNLMLKKKKGLMIDWRKVDRLEFYKRMSMYYKDQNLKRIYDFLKDYLSTEYEKEISTN